MLSTDSGQTQVGERFNLGVLLFSSLVVIVMNMLTDLCYRLIDPRIKTG